MTRVVLKYLLSFCILLSSLPGQVYAHSHNDYTCHTAAKDRTRTSKVYHHSKSLFLKPAASGVKEQHHRLLALLFENEENDETSSSKVYIKNDHYLSAAFYAQAPEHEGILTFYGDFSFTSSCRYLTLQVFRI